MKLCEGYGFKPKLFRCQKSQYKGSHPQNPLQLPIGFWFTYLCQLQGAIGEILLLLESNPVNVGFSFSQLRQLFLDGILLLQEIVLFLQV